jgi:NodT family efflux transporter outer membrane factor (OMF) lipoprotein
MSRFPLNPLEKRAGRVNTRIGALWVLPVALVAGCAVGPDYHSPEFPVPDEWHSTPPEQVRAVPADDPSLAQWWTTFQDPILTRLLEGAVEENKTVQQARARVIEARARRGAAAGGFLPSINASAGANRTDSGARRISDPDGSLDDPDNDFALRSADEIYSAGLDASWELDLFGGQRRALEAASAQVGASEAELRDALITLLGDVAVNYTGLRAAQSRLAFAQANLDAQSELLNITQWRAEAGLATVLDVEQAQTSFQQTRAQIPALESSLVQAMNRLAVLTGQVPGSLFEQLAERRAVPTAPDEIVSSVPADVLRRRPDIRAAERRLAAQSAQVGVATAALYPSLSLSGSIGVQSLSASDVFDGSQTDRFGLSLRIPLFAGGALRQNLRAQYAVLDQAFATYEAAVLNALEEVENALMAWTAEQQRGEALRLGVESARRARELALLQYNSGLVDFQTVVTADRQLISLEDSLAVSEGELTSNVIRLYKALGGGWSVYPAAL